MRRARGVIGLEPEDLTKLWGGARGYGVRARGYGVRARGYGVGARGYGGDEIILSSPGTGDIPIPIAGPFPVA